MAKEKRFAGLSKKETVEKRSELAKALVKFRVSLDPSFLSGEGGVVSLQRDIRRLGRVLAIQNATKEGNK